MNCAQCLTEHGAEFTGTPLSFDVTIATHAHVGADGTEHRYEPHTTVTRYRCIFGHEWSHTERQLCWCGWGAACV